MTVLESLWLYNVISLMFFYDHPNKKEIGRTDSSRLVKHLAAAPALK